MTGAGALISQGAMQQASFEQVEDYLINLPWHSGDAMLTETLWHVAGIAPTDPGVSVLLSYVVLVKWPASQKGTSPLMHGSTHISVYLWLAQGPQPAHPGHMYITRHSRCMMQSHHIDCVVCTYASASSKWAELGCDALQMPCATSGSKLMPWCDCGQAMATAGPTSRCSTRGGGADRPMARRTKTRAMGAAILQGSFSGA